MGSGNVVPGAISSELPLVPGTKIMGIFVNGMRNDASALAVGKFVSNALTIKSPPGWVAPRPGNEIVMGPKLAVSGCKMS